MSTEHVEELIAIYALGGLSREERQAVERHLAGCASCRALAAEALGTVSLLPFAAEPVTPAPAMKQKLMARIQADLAASGQGAPARSDGQADGKAATAAAPARLPAEAPRMTPPARVRTAPAAMGGRRLPLRWAWASAVIAALALAVILGGWGLSLQSELASARAQLELLSRPDVRVVTIPAAKPGQSGQAKLFVAPDSTVALLTVNGLPRLSAQQTYEFWLIRNGQPRPAGIFNVGAGGSERVLVQSADPLGLFDQAGITVEKAGGSQTPTLETLVVVGSLR